MNRNLKTVKGASEITLEGIAVEFVKQDASVKRVTLTDGKGTTVTFSADYGMSVLVPAPPQMIDKWMLQGTYKGITVSEAFDSKYAAESRRDEIGYGEDVAELSIDKTQVPEAE